MCRAETLVDITFDKPFLPTSLMFTDRAPNVIAWRNCHQYCLNGTSPDISLWGWVGWKWIGGLNWLGNSLSYACWWCRDKVWASRQVMWQVPALFRGHRAPFIFTAFSTNGCFLSEMVPSVHSVPWYFCTDGFIRDTEPFSRLSWSSAIYHALGLTTSGIQPWISKVQFLVLRNAIV